MQRQRPGQLQLMVAVAEVKPVVDDGLAMSGSGPGGPGGEWRV